MQRKIESKDRAIRTGVISLQGGVRFPIKVTGTESDYEGVKAKWLVHFARFVESVLDAEPLAAPAEEPK